MQQGERTGRNDLTALPYRINTVCLPIFFDYVSSPDYSPLSKGWRQDLVPSRILEFLAKNRM